MSKNWLIRTKSNHILGPISREKVLELFRNQSIKPDDELCSGNGFWFFVREEDLLKRYLENQEVQGFNPISEAKNVLTVDLAQESRPTTSKHDDITRVGGLNLSLLQGSQTDDTAQHALPQKPAAPAAAAKKKVLSESQRPVKQFKSQSYLQYLMILGLSLIVLLVYFRKNLMRFLIDDAQAQEIVQEKKKSS